MISKQKDSGYRIIYDAPKLRHKAVVESECECPVCRKKDGIKVTATYASENILQNTYECQSCGSLWKGNYFDEGWNPVNNSKGRKLLKNAAIFLIYILLCILISKTSDFLFIAVIALNILAASSCALAGALDGSKESKKRTSFMASALFIGSLLILYGGVYL